MQEVEASLKKEDGKVIISYGEYQFEVEMDAKGRDVCTKTIQIPRFATVFLEYFFFYNSRNGMLESIVRKDGLNSELDIFKVTFTEDSKWKTYTMFDS
ncbi:hypothetical protein [Bacteroides faecalis]|uniref:Uncharacterized protein n=1 Tax=Bacteroides faecalis TaxID=2447885 RepID=A0A401LXK6_9BACE|nr:hypothetical protein [Bacteroides faecalis]GCB36270.1 hypothetical protein KGMB02408_32150 [Bacteroides faecalis]